MIRELRLLGATYLLAWATRLMPKDDRAWPMRKAAIINLTVAMRAS